MRGALDGSEIHVPAGARAVWSECGDVVHTGMSVGTPRRLTSEGTRGC